MQLKKMEVDQAPVFEESLLPVDIEMREDEMNQEENDNLVRQEDLEFANSESMSGEVPNVQTGDSSRRISPSNQ